MNNNIIQAIENLFIMRKDCYSKQIDHKNDYIVLKENLTSEIIRNHLDGNITIACPQVDPNIKKLKWICFDFDGELKTEFEKSKNLFYKLKDKGFNPIIEFSGRRGYHVWLFIEPIDLAIARRFAVEISEDFNPNEIFPKNDRLDYKGFGFQVKLPLGIHRVSMKKSYLFDENLQPLSQVESKEFLIRINNTDRDKIVIKNLSSFLGE